MVNKVNLGICLSIRRHSIPLELSAEQAAPSATDPFESSEGCDERASYCGSGAARSTMTSTRRESASARASSVEDIPAGGVTLRRQRAALKDE